MGLYRRSNFVFNLFRNVGSKLVFKTLTQSNSSSSSFYNPCKFSGISRVTSISSKFGCLNVLKQNKSSLLVTGRSRRYYCVDRNHTRGYRKWFRNRNNVFIVVVVGFGIVISFCFGGMEVVPYTNRKQFLIAFKQIWEADLKGRILPPTHPDSVRVSLIGKNIFDALHRGPRNEQVSNYAMIEKPKDGTLKAEEVLVKEMGLNWEIVVVDRPSLVWVFHQGGGKIVIYSGVLNVFRTDHEIATFIAHEGGN